MKRKLLFTTISLLFTHFVVGQAYTDTAYQKPIERARALLLDLKKDQNIPGLSVAIGKAGRVIWKEGFGLADIKSGAQVTTDTRFRTGSISKSITALALGKLYDQGELDWSDTVQQYVPLQGSSEYPFTIRQLAGHTAGIRHYKGFEFFSNKTYGSVEESLNAFKDDELLFEPGTKYQYTTYGYSVLGRLIEVVSGQSYWDYMAGAVLNPLGMKNTMLEDAGLDETGTATFYRKGGKREAGEVNLSVKWAGGGFLSTPTDLVNMINNARHVVSFSTLQEMITPQKLSDGSSTGYGIGFKIAKVQSTNQLLIHHGGRMVGARSFLLVLLDQQLVIAICANTDADFGLQEVYDMAKIFQ